MSKQVYLYTLYVLLFIAYLGIKIVEYFQLLKQKIANVMK